MPSDLCCDTRDVYPSETLGFLVLASRLDADVFSVTRIEEWKGPDLHAMLAFVGHDGSSLRWDEKERRNTEKANHLTKE